MMRKWISLACGLLMLALLLSACQDAPDANADTETSGQGQSEVQTDSTTESNSQSGLQSDSQSDLPSESQPETNTPTEPPTQTEQNTSTEPSTEPLPPMPAGSIVSPREVGYTYPELQEDLSALAEQYSAHFSYQSIGQSVDGREIYACVVGNPNAPKKIMITGGIHGREYLSSLLVMTQIEYYLSNYETGSYNGLAYADMFEQFAFYVLPMINPDGIMLALCGIESVQTPAVRETLEGIFADNKEDGLTSAGNINDYFAYNWKSNANGVDLNRNFALSNWEDVKTGILLPCFRNYKGPRAASEPETQAVSTYVQSLGEIECMLAFHTAGQVVYWDCGMTGGVREETYKLAQAVCEHTGYQFIYDTHLDASLNDWMTLELGIPTVTVELANVGYPMPTSELAAAWAQAGELWAVSAKLFG